MANTKLPARLLDTSAIPALNVTGDLTVDTTTLKVDSTNNRVGIGIASPLFPLHINSSSTDVAKFQTSGSYTYTRFQNSSKTWALSVGSDFGFYDEAASATRMIIDSSGNVGIGVAPKTDWHTGYRAIQIGESSAFFANTAADEVFMVQNARYTSGGWKYNSSGTAALFDMQSGNTRWRRAVSGSDDGTISWSDSMFIDSSGNVGIGTDSPNDAKLQVFGNSSSDWGGYFYNQNAAGSGLHVETNSYGTEQLLRLSSLTGSGGSNTVRMVVRADGKVGIGNVAPLARMTIGSSQGNSLEFSYDAANGYRNNISNYWNSGIDTRMDFNIGRVANVAPVTVMSVGYNNNVGIGTASPGAKLEITDGDLWLNGDTGTSNPEIFFIDDSGVGTAGAKIRYGNSDGNVYFDHKWNNAGSGFFFRNRVDGTALNTMALVNGIVTMPHQPAFSAFANTNETTAAGATAPFDALIFDQGGNYSIANRRFVAPVAGIYQFSTYTNANGVSPGNAMWCAFAVNGAYRGAYMYLTVPTGANWVLIGGTQTMGLAANDYVEVKAGAAMHWDYGSTAWSNFSGHLVG